MGLDLSLVASIAERAGYAAVLALFGSFRGWWVWGNEHRRLICLLEKDRDEWKMRAERHLQLGETLVAKLAVMPGPPPRVNGL